MDQHQDDYEVMPTSCFLDYTTRSHIARARLLEIFKNEEDWVFVITPDCYGIARKLNELHIERLGQPVQIIQLGQFNGCNEFFIFPHSALSFDEMKDIVKFSQPEEEVRQKLYIMISTHDFTRTKILIDHAISVDHLLG